ncbi:putative lipoprotein [Rothia aeria F0474]|uniref:Lipoprotein n=1 Tax=Rothia aeria F0474 TaxID=1125724 RepID=I0URX3_9MICC|nr:hypothetical protein [Rothia aeria]EID50626.1 putative lipoprotein [Rothia aeria F0474]
MKKTSRNRMAAPVSASFALLLALSACSSSGVNQGGSTNNSGSSESASTSTEDGRQIVGLGDDNKAGKPRPRSERKSYGDRYQVKSDGSWTEKTLSGQEKITVNADGTWVNKIDGREFTLHADGSWESTEKYSGSKTVIHVNPDGSWNLQEQRKENEEPSKKAEVRADGTWEVDELGVKYVGKADGTATKKDSKADEEKPISRSEWPDIFPKYVASLYKEDGSLVTSVPKDGVIPLKPRTALPLGVSAKKAVPGTDEYRRDLAELEGTLLTDENKAGKPRPRPEREVNPQAKVNPDGSWSWKKNEDTELTVATDGTWVQREKAVGQKTTTLYADGSWEEKETKSDGEEATTHVNPDGTWRTTDGSRKEELHADGTWRSESSGGFVTYSDVNGKVYMEGSSGKPFEITNETYTTVRTPRVPSPRVGDGLGIGGGGVLPLTPRKPLYPGQKAFS